LIQFRSILHLSSGLSQEVYGNPQHPDQLQQHTCLNFRNRSTGRLYPWSFAIGDEVERYAVSGSVVFDNADAIVQSAIAGLGLSQMPTFLAAAALAEGDLQEVLQPYRPPEMPVWICYLDRRFVAPRIRVFVDFMASQKAVLTAMYRL
jgi:DNA-binding transcriptional LysR family regulator